MTSTTVIARSAATKQSRAAEQTLVPYPWIASSPKRLLAMTAKGNERKDST
jgi:hypothetical protein